MVTALLEKKHGCIAAMYRYYKIFLQYLQKLTLYCDHVENWGERAVARPLMILVNRDFDTRRKFASVKIVK